MAQHRANPKIKLQGHEKFALREGWLSKGILQMKENPRAFSGDSGPDALGIGANMVKSLRYWLRATGLTEDKAVALNLSDLGELVLENDPYFEDIFTLWLLHSQLVKNRHLATTWFIYFNRCDTAELERGQIFGIAKRELDKEYPEEKYSENSLKSDVDVLLAMYSREKVMQDPEDKSVSPFARLGLIRKSDGVYSRMQPNRRILDKTLILYEILERFETEQTQTIAIDRLTGGDGSLSSIYQLTAMTVNEYLDELDAADVIRVDRTAGLDVIYRKENCASMQVLEDYYRNR